MTTSGSTARFVTSNGEEFDVEPVVVPEKGGPAEAAQHFYQALQVQSDQLRASQFCGDYSPARTTKTPWIGATKPSS